MTQNENTAAVKTRKAVVTVDEKVEYPKDDINEINRIKGLIKTLPLKKEKEICPALDEFKDEIIARYNKDKKNIKLVVDMLAHPDIKFVISVRTLTAKLKIWGAIKETKASPK